MRFTAPSPGALRSLAPGTWRLVSVTDNLFPDLVRIVVYDGEHLLGAAVDMDLERAVGRALGEAWERHALALVAPGASSVGTALAQDPSSAVVAAVAELAERHALASFVARPEGARRMDVPEGGPTSAIRAAGLEIDLWEVGAGLPIPVVVAVLVNRSSDPRLPGITVGSAAGDLPDARTHALLEAVHTSGFVRQLMAARDCDGALRELPAARRALAWAELEAVARYDELFRGSTNRLQAESTADPPNLAELEAALGTPADPVRHVDITPPALARVACVVRASAPGLILLSDDGSFPSGEDPHFFI